MLWVIAILIPCFAESSPPTAPQQRLHVTNGIVNVGVLNDARRMTFDAVQFANDRTQKNFQPFGLSHTLHAGDGPYSTTRGNNTTDNAAKKARGQSDNEIDSVHILILLCFAILGALIGSCIVSLFLHIFVVAVPTWDVIFKWIGIKTYL